MIARTEQEIKDKIEELSYIFDISDDLRTQYERSRLDIKSTNNTNRTKSHLYPLQYDDYISYGIILGLEWTLGLRQTLETQKKNNDSSEVNNKK
jgi:hypothetical protein